MASVFLSYDREDAHRARQFAQALERSGNQVWWDLHVRGGAQFAQAIENALRAADAVVVLWSAHSIESAWVRDEAAAGRDSGRLVPVTIDGTEPPLGFRQFQTMDLSRWKGRGSTAALRSFLTDVEEMGTAGTKVRAPAQPNGKPRFAGKWSWSFAAAVLVALAIWTALIWWRPWVARAQPTLVVRAATPDTASKSLARELSVNLASLQGVQSRSIRLVNVSETSSRAADLVLDVEAAAVGGRPSVVLTNTKDATILWSKDFEPANVADLNQQIALSTSRVLDCAADGLDPRARPAAGDTLKLYLNACAQLDDMNATTTLPLVTALRQVVTKAPGFAPGWSKLLVAEAGEIEVERDNGEVQPGDVAMLRQNIQAARALDPHMPEATLAQVALLPLDDIVGRLELLDTAKSAAADNPAVLSARAMALRNVGRMRDSITDANLAVQADPLSPTRHGDYFAALAFGGQIDAARQELEHVERLWPGSSTATDLKFAYDSRFGDAREALPIAQQRTLKGIVLYLEARLDPSKVDGFISWLINRKDFNWGRLGVVAQALAEFHREELLYRLLSTWPDKRDFAKIGDVWFRPGLRQFRRDPRFIRVTAQTPLLTYWRATGNWPDFCYEPDLQYDCKREAAKYPR